MTWLILNFIKFFVIVQVCSALSLKGSKLDDDEVSNLASRIVSKHFSHLNCITIIAENHSIEDIFLDVLKLPSYISKFQILVNKNAREYCYLSEIINISEAFFEQSCRGFIIRLSSPKCFLTIWRHTAEKSLHRHNPRVLFLPTNKTETIWPDILQSPEISHIPDLAIVDFHSNSSSDYENTFEISGIDWVSDRDIITVCRSSECENHIDNLYQDKMADFSGKELTVATFNYLPYAVLNPLDGTEVRIAVEFAHLHNCNITIITDDYQWGEIYENGTGNGILGNVAEEKADVGLGALYLWYHEYQFLDFSVPYIRTGITCLAPKPQLLSTTLLPVRPYNLVTWFIVFCVLLIGCAALYITKKLDIIITAANEDNEKNKRHGQWFTTIEDTALRTFGFLVLQAYNNRLVESNSVRHLVNWLHVMFLLIATTYNSGLASILTVPSHHPPIDTVVELVNSGLGWGATHDAWIFSLREAIEPPMSTLVNRFRALPKDQLYQNSLTANFAFSVERLPAGHFAVGDYITEESLKHLRLMKQDIYYEHCILVFQKGSPYLNSFNRLIHRLLNSGILLYWETEVARKFLHSQVQAGIKESTLVTSRNHPTTIRLGHTKGAFIILGIGLFVAVLTFISEKYILKNKQFSIIKRKNIHMKPKQPLFYGFYK